MNTGSFYDYGKLHLGAAQYDEHRPETIEDVQRLLRTAADNGDVVRVWAGGNSLSGCSLPRKGETLLRLKGLNHYRFDEPGSISVGAGAMLWDVRDFLEGYGFVLPVYNGGWGAPSVCGFINAGGIGTRRPLEFFPEGVSAENAALSQQPPEPQTTANGQTDYEDVEGFKSLSELHGGFWENVLSITLIDGQGERHEIDRQHDDFRWLFGGYGQLGVMVEAKLRILPAEDGQKPAYPQGQAGRIPLNQPEDPQFSGQAPPPGGMEHLYWLTYLVSPDQEQKAWAELGEMVPKHAPFVKPVSGFVGPPDQDGRPMGYRYNVTFRDFNPPLVYPHGEDFILMGVMCVMPVGKAALDRQLLAFEQDFVDIALRNDFCLYMQPENIGNRVDYKAYYPADVYAAFEALKQKYDPQRRINRGVFFDREADTAQFAYVSRLQVGAMAKLFGAS